jgi:hypothetical protein
VRRARDVHDDRARARRVGVRLDRAQAGLDRVERARASEKTDAGADAGRGRGRRRSQYRPYTHARATSAQASHTSCRRAIGDERSGRREDEEEDAESERAGESAAREAVPFAFLIAPFRGLFAPLFDRLLI